VGMRVDVNGPLLQECHRKSELLQWNNEFYSSSATSFDWKSLDFEFIGSSSKIVV
jgi:hypothetical protein